MRMRHARIPLVVRLTAGLIGLATVVQAADDTARFYGTWETRFVLNGRMVTLVSTHDSAGFKNYLVLPTGNTPAGEGTFSAANGRYKTSAAKPNDSGTYRFAGDNTVICINAAGQTAVWKRDKAPPPEAPPAQPAPAQPAPAQPRPKAALAPDPSLPADTNAAIAAFNRKDYNTAWRDFMSAAQRGDSEAEAGVGAMLFHHLNPPGTGYYAQCEKWLLASANQGNAKGMGFLGEYYYASAAAVAGGINPGVNTAPIPPALQKQADDRFALARQWFERAAAKNDGYAMGNLAIMLDSGVGGPADRARAAELRERLQHPDDPSYTNPDFIGRVTTDPDSLAMKAAWQSGHYADALRNAEARAAKGDAGAQALLGRAYYEGVGVPRNYSAALNWLDKAVAQGNDDAMFILGLMYENGRGVRQDLDKALGLFDRAAKLGQRYAQIEAKGMRMEGEAAEQQARFAGVCRSRGGVADGPLCLSGGMAIDPY